MENIDVMEQCLVRINSPWYIHNL